MQHGHSPITLNVVAYIDRAFKRCSILFPGGECYLQIYYLQKYVINEMFDLEYKCAIL